MRRSVTPTAAELEAIEDLRSELGRDPGRVALALRLGCTRTRAEHLARWLGQARKTDGSGPRSDPNRAESRKRAPAPWIGRCAAWKLYRWTHLAQRCPDSTQLNLRTMRA